MLPKPWEKNFFWILLASCSCTHLTCLQVVALSSSNIEQSKLWEYDNILKENNYHPNYRQIFSVKQTTSPSLGTVETDLRFPNADDLTDDLEHLDNTVSSGSSTMITLSDRKETSTEDRTETFQSVYHLEAIQQDQNPRFDLPFRVSSLLLGQVQLPEGDDSRVPRSRDLEPPQPQPVLQPEPPSKPPEPPKSEPPQLDAQPNDIKTPSPQQIEQRLDPQPIDYEQRRVRLLEVLTNRRNLQGNQELGNLWVRLNPESPNLSPPLEEQKPTPPPKPPQPFGYLLGQVSYFQTNNLFSSQLNPINDGFVYGGLRLVTAPIALGKQTFLSGSVEGNLIKYLNQSEFNYNQFRVNTDIFHRFNRQMYGEFGWSNQQLFYARNATRYAFKAGDRFLNEHSWHLSIGRRDSLSSKLMLDSYYELRASFSDPPENRDRIMNTIWVALNYYLQRPLQVGLNYQYYRADFTQRDRDDQYHRIFANLNYRLSDINNLNFQGGYTLGDSTQSDIDFDGWFLSLTYGWELGRF